MLQPRASSSNATVWGVDPGLTDIFVASDNHVVSNRHRVCKASTTEYYQLAGFKKHVIPESRLARIEDIKNKS